MMSIGRAAVVVLLLLTMAGCGDASPGVQGEPANEPTPVTSSDPSDQLKDKPPFETARDEYTAAMKQMADQVAALMPGTTWQVKEDSWSACPGELANTPGVQVYHYIVFDHPVPDDLWPRALDIVKTGAAGFGADDVQVLVDKPGSKDVVITGPDGVKFEFGTAVQTVFSGASDCRLRKSPP